MADGELRFRAPDGREVPAVPAREASEDAVVWVREWAEERGLDIGAETNVPLWDGTRPDYDWAVAALVSGGGVKNAVRRTAFDAVRDDPCAHPDKGLAWCNRH
jgi:hypothetical protein